MTLRQKGILALLIAVILWGPAPVVTKLALQEIPQFSLTFLRFAIATPIIFLLFFRQKNRQIKKSDFLLFFIAGIVGSVINSLFFFYGIQITSATASQAIFTATPVITALLAHFFLNEKIKSLQWIGVLVGLTGATLVAVKGYFENGKVTDNSMLGNFLIFLAAISWVIYILISKKLSARYSPTTITAVSFLIGLAAFIPFAIWENMVSSAWIGQLGFKGIFGAVYQGIFASVLAVLAYQTGLKLTSAFAAGVILYLNPIITTLVAVPVLGEKITVLFLIGSILILLGSFISTQLEMVKNHVRKRIFRQ
ncbi:DMT family transporter [Candidatus Microgenomates bacterium]|nr:DMT family transporter [Candidatus Microgenomates bacterium]